MIAPELPAGILRSNFARVRITVMTTMIESEGTAEDNASESCYFAAMTTPGGFQVPSPGGRIDGASTFGQYRRITR